MIPCIVPVRMAIKKVSKKYKKDIFIFILLEGWWLGIVICGRARRWRPYFFVFKFNLCRLRNATKILISVNGSLFHLRRLG